jgi:glutamyl-tRNA reductase
MELVLVGWNHRGAPLDLRERLAFSPDRALEALQGLFREEILSEGAIVSTCNRAEVYGVTSREDSVSALAGYFSRFHSVDEDLLVKTAFSARGDGTVRHLFRVASGLDSMVLGEAQILGQIREAHRLASAARTTRAVTNRLFQTAVECGRRVRTETKLGTRPTSVPGIALTLVGRIFETLRGRRVLLLGAGETIELTARLLVDEGASDLVFTNRSPDKAEALAERSRGRSVPWALRVEAVAESDIVLTATGASDPVVTADALRRALGNKPRRGPLLILDMAVPRDVDPEVDDISDVYRYDMDAFGALSARHASEREAEVPDAERIIEESVRRFEEWFGSLVNVDIVRVLRERLEEIRREELARYAGKLSRLSEDDRQLVDRLTESLVAKILHHPTVGLKQGDASDRLERAAAARELFRLDRVDKGKAEK